MHLILSKNKLIRVLRSQYLYILFFKNSYHVNAFRMTHYFKKIYLDGSNNFHICSVSRFSWDLIQQSSIAIKCLRMHIFGAVDSDADSDICITFLVH